jgi:hypothetical protein
MPFANYYLARLKIRAREIDSTMDLLRRAVAADQRRVHRMLKHDAKHWDSIRDDDRFKSAISSVDAAARPGH